MTSKEKSRQSSAPMTARGASLAEQMPCAGEPARRLLAKEVGERWAAETLARIDQKLGGLIGKPSRPKA